MERFATQRVLFDLVQQRLGGSVSSLLPRLLGEEGELTLEILRQALDAADKVALDAVAELCVPLGTGMAAAINLFNPSHVVISGPLAALGEHLLRPLVCEIRSRALSRAVSSLEVRISDLVGMCQYRRPGNHCRSRLASDTHTAA